MPVALSAPAAAWADAAPRVGGGAELALLRSYPLVLPRGPAGERRLWRLRATLEFDFATAGSLGLLLAPQHPQPPQPPQPPRKKSDLLGRRCARSERGCAVALPLRRNERTIRATLASGNYSLWLYHAPEAAWSTPIAAAAAAAAAATGGSAGPWRSLGANASADLQRANLFSALRLGADPTLGAPHGAGKLFDEALAAGAAPRCAPFGLRLSLLPVERARHQLLRCAARPLPPSLNAPGLLSGTGRLRWRAAALLDAGGGRGAVTELRLRRASLLRLGLAGRAGVQMAAVLEATPPGGGPGGGPGPAQVAAAAGGGGGGGGVVEVHRASAEEGEELRLAVLLPAGSYTLWFEQLEELEVGGGAAAAGCDGVELELAIEPLPAPLPPLPSTPTSPLLGKPLAAALARGAAFELPLSAAMYVATLPASGSAADGGAAGGGMAGGEGEQVVWSEAFAVAVSHGMVAVHAVLLADAASAGLRVRLSSQDEPRLLHSAPPANADAGRHELSARLRPGRYTLAVLGAAPRLPERWPLPADDTAPVSTRSSGALAALAPRATPYALSVEVWPLCADTDVSCAAWARRGECAKNAAFMQGACRRSCGECEGHDEAREGHTGHADEGHEVMDAAAPPASLASLAPIAPHCHETTDLGATLMASAALLGPGAPLLLSGRFVAPRVAGGAAAASLTVLLPTVGTEGGGEVRRVLHAHVRAEVAGDGVQLRLVDASGNYTSEVAAGVAEVAGRVLADSPSDEIWAELASYSGAAARYALVISYAARPAATATEAAVCRRLRVRLSLHAAPADAAVADDEWDIDEGARLDFAGPLVAMAHPSVGGCASERLPPSHWVACCGGEAQYDAAAAARLLRHELVARAAALCDARPRPRSAWTLAATKIGALPARALPRLEGVDELALSRALWRWCDARRGKSAAAQQLALHTLLRRKLRPHAAPRRCAAAGGDAAEAASCAAGSAFRFSSGYAPLRQLLPFAVPEGGATLRAALRFSWLDASLALRLLRVPPPNASRAATAPPAWWVDPVLGTGGAVLAEAVPAAGGELRLAAALPRGHYALELAEPPFGKPTALRRCTRFALSALLHRHHAEARGAAAARAARAACAAEPLPPSLDTPGLLGAGAGGRLHARLDVLHEWRRPAQATRLTLRAPSLLRVLAPPPLDGAAAPAVRVMLQPAALADGVAAPAGGFEASPPPAAAAASTAAAIAAASAAANGTWALAAPPGAAAVLPPGEYVLSLSSEPDGAGLLPAARRRCASFALLIDIMPTSWVDDYPEAAGVGACAAGVQPAPARLEPTGRLERGSFSRQLLQPPAGGWCAADAAADAADELELECAARRTVALELPTPATLEVEVRSRLPLGGVLLRLVSQRSAASPGSGAGSSKAGGADEPLRSERSAALGEEFTHLRAVLPAGSHSLVLDELAPPAPLGAAPLRLPGLAPSQRRPELCLPLELSWRLSPLPAGTPISLLAACDAVHALPTDVFSAAGGSTPYGGPQSADGALRLYGAAFPVDPAHRLQRVRLLALQPRVARLQPYVSQRQSYLPSLQFSMCAGCRPS